eukprot:1041341-Pyramimonas_sp.AAC.1
MEINDFGLLVASWDAPWAPLGGLLGAVLGRLGRSGALLERFWAVLGGNQKNMQKPEGKPPKTAINTHSSGLPPPPGAPL